MVKNTLSRWGAGVCYGFLFGAAAGLTAGVLLHNLWPWTIAGVILGVVVGLIVVAVTGRRGQPEPK